LQRALKELEASILRECAEVERNLSIATKSLVERHGDLARNVIEADIKVDNMEVEIEEECLKILALYQPVAVDLRIIVAMLKINNDLERIGDLAVNIAERSAYLAEKKPYPDIYDFDSMAAIVSQMLKHSVDALVEMDVEQAAEVCREDDRVDEMNREMYKLVQDMVKKDSSDVNVLIHLLSISRHYERIADHATNIAEDVIYMIRGNIVRHKTEVYDRD